MGGKKKYIEIFGSFTEPFNSATCQVTQFNQKHRSISFVMHQNLPTSSTICITAITNIYNTPLYYHTTAADKQTTHYIIKACKSDIRFTSADPPCTALSQPLRNENESLTQVSVSRILPVCFAALNNIPCNTTQQEAFTSHEFTSKQNTVNYNVSQTM